tara:strand:- start:3077 stop:3604 length:528 start_codon:yes stop_codon:yes gene_type:complete
MAIFRTELEKRISRKFKEIEFKTKNSFSTIHAEINETQNSLEAMKNYLKNQDKQYKYAKNQDNKIRQEFRNNVNEFTEKIKQLTFALKKAKEIEQEVVIKSDLAKIEDNIKNSFKEQIELFKEQEKEFKKHINDFNKRLHKIEKLHNNAHDNNNKKKKEKQKKKKNWFSQLFSSK